MGVVILFLVVVYVLLSVGFVKLVGKLTGKKKLFQYLAITACVLLPTWDMVLGTIVYFPACFFVPKVAIHETAETDGIYYEGADDYLHGQNKLVGEVGEYKLVATGWIEDALKRGYQNIEFMDQEGQIYGCKSLDKNNIISKYATAICITKNSVMKRYKVNINSNKIGAIEINSKVVIDVSSNRVMAEYRQVAWKILFPFFSWWHEYDGSPIRITCPRDEYNQYYGIGRFYTFEFQVLKPVK